MRRPDQYYRHQDALLRRSNKSSGGLFSSYKDSNKLSRTDSLEFSKGLTQKPKSQRVSVINLSNDASASTGTENTLDVWWFSDDGGLTLLLPHLIARNRRRYKETKNITMRVMNTIGEDELGRAGRELTRLDNLINEKFRIGAEVCNVILKSAKERKIQNPATWKTFEDKWDNVKQVLNETEGIQKGKGDEDFDAILRATKSKVILGESIKQESGKSNLTVINVPVPRKDKMSDPWYPYEYMSWLDGVSQVEKPCLLVHGSNVDCLTFYS